MGLLDAPPSLSMYWGHTGWMSCLRCHKKYTKREPLTPCLAVCTLKKRDPTLRKGHKSVDNPRKQNQTPPFPISSFPPSRWCSISGRMLMPAAFLWCVTRSKTKLRHKHFLNLLILTLYVQYWSTTRQIVFVSSNFDWTLIYQNVVAFCQSQTH